MKSPNPGILATAAFFLAVGTAAHAYEHSSGNGNGTGYSNGNGGGYGNGVATNNGDYGSGGGHGGHDDDDDRDHSGGKAGHFAVLAGGNEVSDDGKANTGDKNARGTATVTVDPRAGKLCFAMIVDNTDKPVAAHVHKGPPGENGPVVVALTAPHKGDPGTSSGCVSNVDGKLLKAIRARPWAYYVNVHTELYPAGALRGQLF